MADVEDGWTTIQPGRQSQARLSGAQRELYERQLLREWEASKGHWSGIGKHTTEFADAKRIHEKILTTSDNDLGWGTYGRVDKVTHRSVCMARKYIHPRRNRTIEMLREEAHVMERLDHEHIVKLVGTYTFRQRELYLLIWPVAVCNLAELLTDLEDLRNGQGDREDIIKRLEALDLKDLSAVEAGRETAHTVSKGNCPLKFLQRIMGCIGQAVTYCHHSNIRHLDLKPTNILLNPDRVYLADFGIARDVNDQEKTTTIGHQGTPKWRAPEIYDLKDWSMKSADIYSLGLIYLNIATMVYHGNLSDFYTALDDLVPHSRADKLRTYQDRLARQALATQQFADAKAATFATKHILELTSKMLSTQPVSRPRAEQVDAELVVLGGIEQLYHNSCCRKSSRYVTKLLDSRYGAAHNERTKLQTENERISKELATLRGMEETYQMRLENEKKKHAKDTELLTKQLDEEREKRRKLEEEVKRLEMIAKRQKPGLPRAERRPSNGAPVSDLNGGLMIRMRPRVNPTQPQSQSTPQVATVAAPRPLASRIPTDPPKAWTGRNLAITSSLPEPVSRTTDSPSPNPLTPMSPANHALRSRGSGSKLPVAKHYATPIRSNTPTLTRDPSLTDSTQFSMASSTWSRRSLESKATGTEAPTPLNGSPAVKQSEFVSVVVQATADTDPFTNDETPSPAVSRRASTAASIPPSTTASIPPSTQSAMSSPRTTKAELASVADSEDGLVPAKVPSLQPAKSWAAVVGESNAVGKMMASMPPIPRLAPRASVKKPRGSRPYSMYV